MPIVYSKAMAETILETINQERLYTGLMGFLKTWHSGPYVFVWPNGQLKSDWTTCIEIEDGNQFLH